MIWVRAQLAAILIGLSGGATVGWVLKLGLLVIQYVGIFGRAP